MSFLPMDAESQARQYASTRIYLPQNNVLDKSIYNKYLKSFEPSWKK